MSHLNSYKFKNKKIKTKEERAKALQYIENIFSHSKNNSFDNLRFNQIKRKIKKWGSSENSSDKEIDFFKKLMEIEGGSKTNLLSEEKVLKKFSNINKKIARFNDKKRAIQEFIELYNTKKKENFDSTSRLNIGLIESIFKIPLKNNLKLSADHQEKIICSYFEKNFPLYEIILSIVHHDETNPHVHIFVNGKNSKSGRYNFVQDQYEYCKNKYKLFNFPQANSKLSADQLKIIGEFLQDDFYKHANSYLTKNNIDVQFYQLALDTNELERRRKIKADSTKRIADREYNTARYYISVMKSAISYLKEILNKDMSQPIAKRKAIVLAERIKKNNSEELTYVNEIKNEVLSQEDKKDIKLFRKSLKRK